MKYQTIVADPPWEYGTFNSFSSTGRAVLNGYQTDRVARQPYSTLHLGEIKALPVADWSADAAHLYLWTTQRYLWDAPTIVEAWGFKPSSVLTWCKPPMGSGLGFAFAPTTEFVLFAHRGGLKPLVRHSSTWFQAKRPWRQAGHDRHSAKPESFYDLVEQVSPGPYLELFARRQRLGWDTWGDEALEHIGLETRVMPVRDWPKKERDL